MPDQITGVLVLQKFPDDPYFGIWFEYTRADGIIGYSYIPAKEKDAPNLTDKRPLWDFVRENPTLHCSPSVRILGPHPGDPDHFHNQGQWSNHYVIMAQPYGAEPDAREVCQEINKGKTKEERDKVILVYRAKGILE